MKFGYRGNWRSGPAAAAFWTGVEHSVDFNSNKSCIIGAQDSSGDKWFWGISDGTGNRITALSATTTDITTLATVIGIFDKLLGTTNKRNLVFNTASVVAATPNTVGTVGTSAFEAEPWYIGGRQSQATQRGPFNVRRWAIYESLTELEPDTTALNTALT
jgi:hypothetical protein